MTQFLFGKSPSVSTQPTTTAAQQTLMQQMVGGLESGALWPGSLQYGGPTAAGPSGLQTTSLAGLENLAAGMPGAVTPQQTSAVSSALDAYTKGLTAQAPTIDPTAAFQQGVVQPLTSDFTQYTIPAITGQYGKSAGAAYSSDALGARQQAGTNLARTLSQTGSQYALGAQEANQQAALTQQQIVNQLLGISPTVTGLPGTTQESAISPLTALLQAGNVPYQIQQTQDVNAWQNYLNMINQSNQMYQLAGTAATTPTISPVTTGGSTGLLSGILSSPLASTVATALL